MIILFLIEFLLEFHYWVIQTGNSFATFLQLHDPTYLPRLKWAAVEVVIVGFALWARRRHATFFKKIKQPNSWKTYIAYIMVFDVVLFGVGFAIFYVFFILLFDGF